MSILDEVQLIVDNTDDGEIIAMLMKVRDLTGRAKQMDLTAQDRQLLSWLHEDLSKVRDRLAGVA